jgi:hypothetical protein
MYKTQITVKDKNVTSAQLANFLKKHIDSHLSIPLSYYLDIARKLINGETYTHDYPLEIPKNDFVNVSTIIDENDPVAKMLAERDYYYELMLKGANGDSEAAIEFCKAVKEGKYNNSPFA